MSITKILAPLIALVVFPHASADTTPIPATGAGSYSAFGFSIIAPDSRSNLVYASGGQLSGPGRGPFEARGFLSFDLSTVTDPIVAATLRVSIESYVSEKTVGEVLGDCYHVANETETFNITYASTPVADLLTEWPAEYPTYSAEARTIFMDLGTTPIGVLTVGEGDEGGYADDLPALTGPG